VAHRVLTDKTTGASRGVGFVRYTTLNEAKLALKSMDGVLVEGGDLPLSVTFAFDKEDQLAAARPYPEVMPAYAGYPPPMPASAMAYPAYQGYEQSIYDPNAYATAASQMAAYPGLSAMPSMSAMPTAMPTGLPQDPSRLGPARTPTTYGSVRYSPYH